MTPSRVCLLLPPSEAKDPGGRGRSLRRAGIGGPLAAARCRMLEALAATTGLDRAAASAALHLPNGVAEQALAANATVLDAPTMPALRRYRGTVYEGLAFEQLSPGAQLVAGRTTFVFSGLWGVLRGDERVPLYRVPAKATLIGVGVASTYWRPILDHALPGLLSRGLIIDLRSSDYTAMWRPRAAIAARTISVRVVSPMPRGGYGVISYASKLAKGRLCAAVLERLASGARVDVIDDLADAWKACGGAGVESTAAGGLDLYTE